MIAKLCYFFGYTPNQVYDLTFPQFFHLCEQLPELVKDDPRSRG